MSPRDGPLPRPGWPEFGARSTLQHLARSTHDIFAATNAAIVYSGRCYGRPERAGVLVRCCGRPDCWVGRPGRGYRECPLTDLAAAQDEGLRSTGDVECSPRLDATGPPECTFSSKMIDRRIEGRQLARGAGTCRESRALDASFVTAAGRAAEERPNERATGVAARLRHLLASARPTPRMRAHIVYDSRRVRGMAYYTGSTSSSNRGAGRDAVRRAKTND